MKRILYIGCMLISFSKVALYAQDKQPMIGQPAPVFELNGTDDKKYSLDQMKGSYVVIHFAATWCPFCNAEAPFLEELSGQYRGKNVRVFIVDVKEDKTLVEKSLERFHFSFPVLLDTGGIVSARYAPEGVQKDLARHEVPIASNLIIDKKGNIRFYSLLNTTSFDAKLTKLRQKLDEILKDGN